MPERDLKMKLFIILREAARRLSEAVCGSPKTEFVQTETLGNHTGYIEVFMQGKCGHDTETTFELEIMFGNHDN